MDRVTERMTHIVTDTHVYRKTDFQTDRQMDGDTDTLTHRLTVIQFYRNTDKQAERGTERQMESEIGRSVDDSQ